MTETKDPREGLFSSVLPKLQLVWDATSYDYLLRCPRSYQYRILEGWAGSGIDIEFGGYYAFGQEVFHKRRLAGDSILEATIHALQQVAEATWADGKPWGGRYEEQWHCTGTKPYKNKQGNRAKCPWSHKGHWFPTPGPSECGECGSPTEVERHWLPLDKAKDRYNLMRAIMGYAASQPEDMDQGLRAIDLGGKAAVEHHFMMPLPFGASTGEPYALAGYWDRAARFGEEGLVVDNKTTKHALDTQYWSRYNLSHQIDIYDLVGLTLFNFKGVAIEAMQVMVGGQRYGLRIFNRSDAQREEFLQDMQSNLKEAERYAREGHWPMKKTACYLCHYNKVCDKEPSQRRRYLEDMFTKRTWNPAQEKQP